MYSLATKILHKLPPETAHHLAVKMLRFLPVKNKLADLDLTGLSQELMGLTFPHPLGLAAGFDKDADVFDKLGQLGFSFVEIGSVTPLPQPGNPKPRLFRLTEHEAIINRYGFNSKGLNYAHQQLKKQAHTCVTGVNLGKNKDTINYIDDFLTGAETLIDQADYFTLNISSPNTPGLRDLQTAEALKPIIAGIQALIRQQSRKVPLLIKISPDMTLAQETTLIEYLAHESVDGIIISNTTLSREGVTQHPHSAQAGGLSGAPLKDCTTAMIRRAHKITQGRLTIIGCGGITSGQDAYEKLTAGAHLLQLYTAFIYQGPAVIRRILVELKAIMAREGIKNISEFLIPSSF